MNKNLLRYATNSKLKNLEIEPEDKVEAKEWRKNIPGEILSLAGKVTEGLAPAINATVIRRITGANLLVGGSYAKGTSYPDSDLDLFGLERKESLSLDKLSIALGGVKIDYHELPHEEVFDYLKNDVGFIEVGK
jgi:hypothetical protein